MGCCGSQEQWRRENPEEHEATLPPHEATARRLQRVYGISLPAEAFIDDKSSEGNPEYPITVKLPDGQDFEVAIRASERVVLFKVQAHEELGATPIAPPAVAKLRMGGIELSDGDAFADHGVEQGATLIMSFDPPMKVSFPDFQETPVTVWGEELMESVLWRLKLHKQQCWIDQYWMLERPDGVQGGSIDITKTAAENGLVDGACLRMFDMSPYKTDWGSAAWCVRYVIEPDKKQLALGRPVSKKSAPQGANRKLYVAAGAGDVGKMEAAVAEGGDVNCHLFQLLNPWDGSNGQHSGHGVPLSYGPRGNWIDQRSYWNQAKEGKCGDDVDMKYSSRTPLHEACRAGNTEMVAALLKLGANGFALCDVDQRGPITPAEECQHYKSQHMDACLQLLLEAGY